MNNNQVMEAFKIFSSLSANGTVHRDEATSYMDESIRGMLMQFAESVDTTIVSAGDYLYLIPLTVHSKYHVSNQDIKDKYLSKTAVNMDIYLLYVATIIFIGEFYDSYQRMDATRDFLLVNDWMDAITNRLSMLQQLDEEELEELEEDYEYNWIGIIKKWDSLDIIKEGISKQTARTKSRRSFMNQAKNFLISEGLAAEIGPEELAITEKTSVIMQRFFMDYEYHRDILHVLYEYLDYNKESEVD